MQKYFLFFLAVIILTSCNNNTEATQQPIDETTKTNKAKFEPEDGKCLVFIGQELEAIGGLEEYNDGYLDHFPTPAGFTMYTDFMPGSESFGFIHKGLDGLTTTDDWGDSPSNMSLQIADTDFANMALAIGLDMKDDHEDDVANGSHDSLITELGNWIKGLGDRPVFLRIGYEFDGHPWNSYDREDYITAFRRIKDTYDEMDITNVAYIWQSRGLGSKYEELKAWYPGDEYVDWCAFSFFAPDNKTHPMIQFAKDHNKPVFMAEATPIVPSAPGVCVPMDFSNAEDATRIWDDWFVPFFRTVETHPKTVKAFSYINCHWKNHAMWKENTFFKDIDARLQLSEEASKKWKTELEKDTYIMASENLFEDLK